MKRVLINNAELKPKDIFGAKTDYEKWEYKSSVAECVIDVVAVIISFVMLIMLYFLVCATVPAEAKTIKEYAGKMVCTSYHVSDNTPRGTRATSTGARATEYHTIAVDRYNPVFPYGTRLYIKGFGDGIVQDCGNLARNGAHLDLFTAEGDGFKESRKVWIVRDETPKEKAERLRKQREKRQRHPFTLMHSLEVPVGVVVADPFYISGGTVRIGWSYYDVMTIKGLGNRLIVNNFDMCRYQGQIMLDEVCEEAVG